MKKILIACLLFLAVILAGCKDKEETTEVSSENQTVTGALVPPVFEVEDSFEVQIGEETSVYHIYDGKIYYLVANESDGKWEYSLCSKDINGASEKYPIDALKNREYVEWCLSEENEKDTLAVLSKNDSGYDVIIVDLGSLESKSLYVDGNDIRKKRLLKIAALDGRGYVLQTYEDIFILSDEGKIEEGSLYKPEGYSIFASDKGVELMKGQTLYSYSTDTMEIVPECFLTDCKIGNEHVMDICLSEGKYYVLMDKDDDMILQVLSMSAIQERKEKKKLLLYQPFSRDITQDDLDKYNFDNDEYEIVLDGDRCDVAMRFWKETKPDIVVLIGYEALNMPYYARQGYFVDLLPFIDASEQIARDDLNTNMVEAFSYNGGLYGLSERLAFQSPMIYAEVDTEGYNVETAVDIYGNAARERNLENGLSTNFYLDLLLTGILDDMVKDESGGREFNRQLVKDILIKVKKATDGIENKDLYNTNISERDKRFLSMSRIESVVDVSTLQDGYNMKPVGYPSVSGEPVYLAIYSDIMSVSSFCEYPEGAYEFIEYMMTRSKLYGNQNGSLYCLNSLNKNGRYPGTESGYTELVPITSHIDGEEFEIKFTDENEASLFAMSENYVLDTELYWDVSNVIVEEAAYYFANEKGIDEVMDIIENRINLILAEYF